MDIWSATHAIHCLPHCTHALHRGLHNGRTENSCYHQQSSSVHHSVPSLMLQTTIYSSSNCSIRACLQSMVNCSCDWLVQQYLSSLSIFQIQAWIRCLNCRSSRPGRAVVMLKTRFISELYNIYGCQGRRTSRENFECSLAIPY